jgi:hypothetical protein
MVDYLRDAPRLYNEARANLDRYDAMPAAGTAAEFLALGRGELYAAATSYDILIGGGGVKGATWLLRGLKMMLREAGTAAITDSIKQWQNIEAGIQEKFDGGRTAVSAGAAGLSGLFGAIRKRDIDDLSLGIRSKAEQKIFDFEIAAIEFWANMRPVFKNFKKAEVGWEKSKFYSETFFRKNKGLKREKVEVHHAVEQKVLEKYPGLFSVEELHSIENLRGIGRDRSGNLLHRSIIRLEWDEFYRQHKTATKDQVLDFATAIDRKYGGLFIPPL